VVVADASSLVTRAVGDGAHTPLTSHNTSGCPIVLLWVSGTHTGAQGTPVQGGARTYVPEGVPRQLR